MLDTSHTCMITRCAYCMHMLYQRIHRYMHAHACIHVARGQASVLSLGTRAMYKKKRTFVRVYLFWGVLKVCMKLKCGYAYAK